MSPSSPPAIPITRPRSPSLRPCRKPAPTSSSSACRSPTPWPTAPPSRPRRNGRLKSGQTMKKTLAMVKAFRASDPTTPIVLMGYYNPIYVYPVDRFVADAVEAGSGRSDRGRHAARGGCRASPGRDRGGLNFIRLATPTTDAKRLPAVLANTSGFVYYVSIAGITGTKAPDLADGRRPCRPHQGAYRPADCGRLRREDGRTGERAGAHRRRRGGRLGPGHGHCPKPRCRGQRHARHEAASARPRRASRGGASPSRPKRQCFRLASS